MAKTEKTYMMSIRCHFPNGDYTQHRQALTLTEVKRWIEAYEFTHPTCTSVSFKIWLKDEDIT